MVYTSLSIISNMNGSAKLCLLILGAAWKCSKRNGSHSFCLKGFKSCRLWELHVSLSFDLAAAILLLQNLLERQILKNKSVPSQSLVFYFFMQSPSCFLFVLLLLIPKQKFHGVLWNTELNRTECEFGINT